MNYKEKLKSINCSKLSIDLRDELLAEEKRLSSNGCPGNSFDFVRECQNVNFWIDFVNARIKLLNREGYHIDNIKLSVSYTEEEVKEKMRLSITSAKEIYEHSILIEDWISDNLNKK